MTRFIDDYLLYLLAKSSSRASAEFHAQLPVPVAIWRVLATLYPDAPASLGDLAEACLTKQSTMTRQIDRMERDGLVTRAPVPGDRRQVAVALTKPGRALASQLAEQAKQHEAALISDLTPEDIAALKSTLAKLTQD